MQHSQPSATAAAGLRLRASALLESAKPASTQKGHCGRVPRVLQLAASAAPCLKAVEGWRHFTVVTARSDRL